MRMLSILPILTPCSLIERWSHTELYTRMSKFNGKPGTFRKCTPLLHTDRMERDSLKAQEGSQAHHFKCAANVLVLVRVIVAVLGKAGVAVRLQRPGRGRTWHGIHVLQHLHLISNMNVMAHGLGWCATLRVKDACWSPAFSLSPCLPYRSQQVRQSSPKLPNKSTLCSAGGKVNRLATHVSIRKNPAHARE